MRESLIQKKVTDYAKRLGWLAYKFASPSNRGVPDLIYIRDGLIVFVEFKTQGKRPSKLQANTHKKMMDQGACVYVVDSCENGIALFNALEVTRC